ncbi:MAG: DUF1638 domain-containing protein [Proteobacteria bacterium]|nr:DUF1638 domain-containing protein [Pseudomonadota bacterium]MBI3499166.1 DUF1638 domain-containing protein [Pseudomonadota bacterium]
MAERAATLLIGCGALAPEVLAVASGFPGAFDLVCLPAQWHNTPERIAPGVRARIREARAEGYRRILVLYGDCGSGGGLDQVLAQEGVKRIAGPHCYQFYMGTAAFTELAEAEPGCFFLTDYLARHFDRLIIEGLGLDRHPELRDDYFRHYTKLVYLAQTEDPELTRIAAAAADRLELAFQRVFTGYGELGQFMRAHAPAPIHG